MVYVDSSALVKLLVSEPESRALREYLIGREELVSSALAEVELLRALSRIDGSEEIRRRARLLLDGLALLPLDSTVLKEAASFPVPGLRTLDALHLAAALSLADLDAFVTYDRRLAEAAAAAGLPVASPG